MKGISVTFKTPAFATAYRALVAIEQAALPDVPRSAPTVLQIAALHTTDLPTLIAAYEDQSACIFRPAPHCLSVCQRLYT